VYITREYSFKIYKMIDINSQIFQCDSNSNSESIIYILDSGLFIVNLIIFFTFMCFYINLKNFIIIMVFYFVNNFSLMSNSFFLNLYVALIKSTIPNLVLDGVS
jgi:hypothetical protein